jgi:hypothetical protein
MMIRKKKVVIISPSSPQTLLQNLLRKTIIKSNSDLLRKPTAAKALMLSSSIFRFSQVLKAFQTLFLAFLLQNFDDGRASDYTTVESSLILQTV